MNIETFTGSLAQNEKYGIKFNSNIPTKHKWYAIVQGDYLGINEGEYIVTDDDNTLIASIRSLDYIPHYMKSKFGLSK